MPTFDEMLELVRLAAERAATEVITYIPEKPGDHFAGKIVENGTLTTIYGTVFTSTFEPVGPYEGIVGEKRGTDKSKDAPDLLRVAWMGVVLDAQYRRLLPQPDDFVAFHYQRDVSPKSGMKDYALIQAVVLDGITGKAKNPVNLDIVVPSTQDVANADPRTGEINPGQNPTDPANAPAGEVPFE